MKSREQLIKRCGALQAMGAKLGVAMVKRQRPSGSRVKLLGRGPLGEIRAVERRDDGRFVVRADFCPAAARSFFQSYTAS